MWAFPEMEQVLEKMFISKVAEGSERLETQTQLFHQLQTCYGYFGVLDHPIHNFAVEEKGKYTEDITRQCSWHV